MSILHKGDEKKAAHASHDDQKAKAQRAPQDQASPEEQAELRDQEVRGLANVPSLNKQREPSKAQKEHNERQEALAHPEAEKIQAEQDKMSQQLADSQKHSDGTVPAQERVRADLNAQKKGVRG